MRKRPYGASVNCPDAQYMVLLKCGPEKTRRKEFSSTAGNAGLTLPSPFTARETAAQACLALNTSPLGERKCLKVWPGHLCLSRDHCDCSPSHLRAATSLAGGRLSRCPGRCLPCSHDLTPKECPPRPQSWPCAASGLGAPSRGAL